MSTIIWDGQLQEVTADIVESAHQKALQLSQNISLVERDIFEFSQFSEILENHISLIKSEIYLYISKHISENGKPTFSNEGQRTAELDKVISGNPSIEISTDIQTKALQYVKNLSELKVREDTISSLKRTHSDLLRQFSIAKTMFEYIALGRRQ